MSTVLVTGLHVFHCRLIVFIFLLSFIVPTDKPHYTILRMFVGKGETTSHFYFHYIFVCVSRGLLIVGVMQDTCTKFCLIEAWNKVKYKTVHEYRQNKEPVKGKIQCLTVQLWEKDWVKKQ